MTVSRQWKESKYYDTYVKLSSGNRDNLCILWCIIHVQIFKEQ